MPIDNWQVKRRERTRHLIELGGLVMKAGLVELTDDDRAVILGLLVDAASKLRVGHAEVFNQMPNVGSAGNEQQKATTRPGSLSRASDVSF